MTWGFKALYFTHWFFLLQTSSLSFVLFFQYSTKFKVTKFATSSGINMWSHLLCLARFRLRVKSSSCRFCSFSSWSHDFATVRWKKFWFLMLIFPLLYRLDSGGIPLSRNRDRIPLDENRVSYLHHWALRIVLTSLTTTQMDLKRNLRQKPL